MAKILSDKLGSFNETLQGLINYGVISIGSVDETQSYTEKFAERLNYVLHIVSLWSHACMIDGELAIAEEMSVGQLINYFFGDENAIFPIEKIDMDAVFNEITETFLAPRPLQEILDYAGEDEELAAVFYEQACCIVASDGKLHEDEREFLSDLSQKLHLSLVRQKLIESKYIQDLVH
jgi:ABC-type bacteriocin/lantibiotic exporter with double-glycine peptidase domain